MSGQIPLKEDNTRLQRLINLLPWLVSNQDSSFDEVAERFEVSRKQLLSDLVLLTFTGPDQFGGGLVDISYDDKFITVKDAKGLERPMSLRQIEIVPLILGLKLIQQRLDSASRAEVEALIGKLTDLSGLTRVDSESLLIEPIKPNSDSTLAIIKQAMRDNLWLQFSYELANSIGASEVRTVEPKEVMLTGTDVYLSAHDASRDGHRVFRVSRMSACEAIPAVISHEGALKESELESLPTLVLRLLPEAIHALEEFPNGEIETKGTDEILASFPIYSEQWACQTTLSLAPWLVGVEPTAISQLSVSALEEMIENHKT